MPQRAAGRLRESDFAGVCAGRMAERLSSGQPSGQLPGYPVVPVVPAYSSAASGGPGTLTLLPHPCLSSRVGNQVRHQICSDVIPCLPCASFQLELVLLQVCDGERIIVSAGRKGRGESSAVGSGAVPFPVLPAL